MHTYRKTVDDARHPAASSWTVGYWLPERPPATGSASGGGGGIFDPRHPPGWHAIQTFKTEKMAARFANYLNGGTGQLFQGELT
jgi:hypothetical protein